MDPEGLAWIAYPAMLERCNQVNNANPEGVPPGTNLVNPEETAACEERFSELLS